MEESLETPTTLQWCMASSGFHNSDGSAVGEQRPSKRSSGRGGEGEDLYVTTAAIQVEGG